MVDLGNMMKDSGDAADLLKGNNLENLLDSVNIAEYVGKKLFIETVKGLVIDIRGESKSDNAEAMIFNRKTDNCANQQFIIEQHCEAYKITASHSGKVLCVGTKSDGIVQQSFTGALCQLWHIKEAKKQGYVKFINAGTGKCIDVPGSVFEANKNLWQYEDNDTSAQQFKLVQ